MPLLCLLFYLDTDSRWRHFRLVFVAYVWPPFGKNHSWCLEYYYRFGQCIQLRLLNTMKLDLGDDPRRESSVRQQQQQEAGRILFTCRVMRRATHTHTHTSGRSWRKLNYLDVATSKCDYHMYVHPIQKHEKSSLPNTCMYVAPCYIYFVWLESGRRLFSVAYLNRPINYSLLM